MRIAQPIALFAAFSALLTGPMSAYASDDTDKPQISTTHPHLATGLLVGVDADHDGIRDDVASLVNEHSGTEADRDNGSKVKAELKTALANSAPPRTTSSGPGCLDYLLLDSKDQATADRYVRARTNGVFGTHPCDPVVSPLLERPFETDYAQLNLGPVTMNYMKHE
ncbi:MAG: hypothetical protein ACJ8OJ_15995 [Povalibacter sp.]|jgi:hypothetical protein